VLGYSKLSYRSSAHKTEKLSNPRQNNLSPLPGSFLYLKDEKLKEIGLARNVL
jgi:hypothetical protein